jgi:hypothetical protein
MATKGSSGTGTKSKKNGKSLDNSLQGVVKATVEKI